MEKTNQSIQEVGKVMEKMEKLTETMIEEVKQVRKAT
jgi:hypothetical protein